MKSVAMLSELKGSLSRSSGLKLTLLLTLMVLSVVLTFTGAAYSATYYVAPNGNDGSGGTSGAPWATFAKATHVLQPGDTLYLEDGIYTQPLNIMTTSGTSGNLIYFKAVNEGNAIVSTTYGQGGALTITVPYIEVDGINFRNSGPYDPSTECATDGVGYSNTNGIAIWTHDVTLRRVTANGSSGCNSAVISIGNAQNVLLEDCAASGQGRVVLNMLECSGVTIRRCWLNYTGPSTGGGDTANVTQVYDSSYVLMENNIGVNYTSQGIEYFNTWAHYSSASGNGFYGNIGYNGGNSNIAGGMFADFAECGEKVSGTVFSNNVAIISGGGGNGGIEINADPGNGSVFINNTFVSPNNSGGGITVSDRSSCPSQSSAIANVSSNSFLNTWNGLGASSSSPIQAHDYNNFYNMYGGEGPLYDPQYMGPSYINTHEIKVMPNYDTATYGAGAYLMAPSALKGLGANGTDIGANVIYEYVNGTLTGTPLWPWPMESRIVAEFGVSPTWQTNGGLWKTLNGLYGTSSTSSSTSGSTSTSTSSLSSDTTPPAVPAGISTTVVSSSQINLAWTASTDPVVSGQITSGLAGYKVYRNGTLIGTTATANYQDTGLNASTAYSYTVSAYDVAGNVSAQSGSVSATTESAAVTSTAGSSGNSFFAVHAGGGQYTNQAGVVYQPDMDYTWGSTGSTSAAITGTQDSALYQTERFGNFSYNIPLANGSYNVTLKFAEIYWNAAGQRIFNVSVQGTQVISNLDVFAKVGKDAAYDVSIPVVVTNGTLNINFTSVVDSAKVSAIEVTPTGFAVDAGGGQYTSQAGVVYQPDTNYSGGSTGSTTAAITGTSDGTLYQTERYGNFSYNIPLADGSYNVTLKFAEIYWNAVGQRIFNVSMQGTQVISDLDIFAKVGKDAAYDVSIPVVVTNGMLNINFTSVVDNAKVSAIEVTPTGTASTPVTSTVPAPVTLSPDTTPPSVPAGLSATVVSSSQINLAWTASADPVVAGQVTSGMAGYKVYRNGTLIGTTATANYQDTGLNASTAYSYTVSAYDAAGNVSGQSGSVSATTESAAVTSTAGSAVNALFAVHAGGGQYTDQAGVVYQADLDYTWGSASSTTAAITGTPDSALYQTERFGNFSYSIPIANGSYTVTLKFAETYWNAAGQRIFNVSMQGTQVISDLDIFAKVGKDAAYNVSIPVLVTNGTLNIDFTPVVDNAEVSAIEVTSGVIAVHVGGGQYTNEAGSVIYQSDRDYIGGTTSSTTTAITGTSDSTLYQSDRFGNFSYGIPVANGNYTVTLKFAETYWNVAGQRVFNVSMQGTQVVSDLDIFAKVGKDAAYDVSIPAVVTNGLLNINFTSVVDNAEVSAIEVTPTGTASTPVTSTVPAPVTLSPDTTPPSVPAGLSATVVSSSQINLAWTASADLVVAGQVTSGMAGYKVYRNGTLIGTTATANYQDTGLNASTAYSYTVSAYDAAGNVSGQSGSVSATTESAAVTSTAGSAVNALFAVHAGGGQYTDQAGVVYQADLDYTWGSASSTTAAITGTPDSALYQTERFGNFSYSIPIANGSYTVTLKFAETYWNAAGQRIFNVSMQGTQVISDLDIFAKVGKDAAYNVSIPVLVTNGTLNIDFTPVVDNAEVSAIEVTSGVIAVHVGGGQYTNEAGSVIYQSDRDYIGGTTSSTTTAITGTPDSTLYQSDRFGNFSYGIPVANGNYTVTLKFAETYWNVAGQRVFNVSMQGTQVVSDLDIFAKVGKDAAYDVSIPAVVTNGLLNINFTSVVDNAEVSAIEVTPN